jgi:AcrR family transcriptional regulator
MSIQPNARSSSDLTPIAPAAIPSLPARSRSDGTLRRLQEEALLRFGERGYHGTSVREITKAAGVRASSLYAHLPSKEHLLRELVLLAHVDHRDALRQAILGSGAEPAGQLRSLVRAHVLWHASYPLLATVANAELHALSAEGLAEALAVRHESERLLMEVAQRGVDLGAFTCPDAWLAAAAIGGMGIRVAIWFRPGSRFSADEVADAYAELALKMLA